MRSLITHHSSRIFLAVVLLFSGAVYAGQSIHGIVTNEAGKPVSGARVILLRSYPDEAGIEIGRAVSDASGGFSISYQDPEPSSLPTTLHLVATSGDLLGLETVGNPRINRQIALMPRISASGSVENDKGKPVPGASVQPALFTRAAYFGMEELDYDRIRMPLEVRATVTNDNGEFRITGLPSDWDISFRARKDGFEDAVGSGTMTLRPGKPSLGWIMGKVSGMPCPEPVEGPVAGVRVIAARTDSEESRHWTAITKSDGSFEFDSLPSGTYSVFVLEADRPIQPVEGIDVNANQTSEVKLHAVEGTLVQGLVLDKGTGADISGVMLMSPGSKPALSGPDGSFSIRMLAGQGMIQVVGTRSGYQDFEHELDVPETGEVTGVKLELSPAFKIIGHVVESGKAVEGALIRLITENGPIGLVESDPDGSYSFVLDTQPQSSWLVAYDPATRWVSMTSTAEIVLQPPATLAGTVKDSDGKPIPDAKVIPMLQVGRYKIYSLHNQARTGENGKFTVTGLIPEASYTFRIEAEGFKEAAIPLNAKLTSGKSATTDFVLERARQ